MLVAAIQGFGLGLGMIAPIGAQNTYVLNRGLDRNYHLASATICSCCDAILISAGIFGGAELLARSPAVLTLVTAAGIAFLVFYGLTSLLNAARRVRSAHRRSNKTGSVEPLNPLLGRKTLGLVILGTFSVTLLNPHVYLDTVVLLGSIGGQYEPERRYAFAIGAIAASFIWFFCLSLAAARMAPLLENNISRILLDLLVCAVMLLFASQLILRLLV